MIMVIEQIHLDYVYQLVVATLTHMARQGRVTHAELPTCKK